MLQETQRMSAPSAASVSISTAVWIVMCSEPAMRAPFKGFFGAELLARRHQAGHFGFGQRDFLAAELGERDVLDDVIGEGGLLGSGGHGGVLLRTTIRFSSCPALSRTSTSWPKPEDVDGRDEPGHDDGLVVLNGPLERLDQIGLLPGEAAFVVRRTAEMTVSRGAGIDRAVEVKMAANAARRQVHGLRHCLLELVLRHLSGAVRIDIDRQRPRHANRVS